MTRFENAGKELRHRIEQTLRALGIPPSVYTVDALGSTFVEFLRDYATDFDVKESK